MFCSVWGEGVVFGFPELPGLFIRTINHFPLDLQFFAYAAATL